MSSLAFSMTDSMTGHRHGFPSAALSAPLSWSHISLNSSSRAKKNVTEHWHGGCHGSGLGTDFQQLRDSVTACQRESCARARIARGDGRCA